MLDEGVKSRTSGQSRCPLLFPLFSALKGDKLAAYEQHPEGIETRLSCSRSAEEGTRQIQKDLLTVYKDWRIRVPVLSLE